MFKRSGVKDIGIRRVIGNILIGSQTVKDCKV